MYRNYADESRVVPEQYLGNANAPVLSESELMPVLVSALDQLTKYHRPATLPQIIRVPHERIEMIVCRAKCGALAAYRPGEGIYLDDRLKPETDLFGRSVLLHELVHYLQDINRELVGMKPCQRWYQREQEAYAVQKKFLMMAGSPVRVGYSARQSPCEDSISSSASPHKP
jgi:hypothetical protein